MRRLDRIAYLLQFAGPQLFSDIKTEADRIVAFLALARLRSEEFGWFNPLLGPQLSTGTTVLDIGAFQGDFSAEVLRTMTHHQDPPRAWRPWGVKDSLRLVALEPNPGNYRALRQRAKAKNWGESFCALRLALYSMESEKGVPFKPRSFQSHLVMDPVKENQSDTITVRLSTLDSLISSNACGLREAEEIFLMKIDTEGMDAYVLEGGVDLLGSQRVRFLIFEFGDLPWAEELEITTNKLWEQGYGCFLLLDHLLVPVNGGWHARAYRKKSRDGLINNVDVLCARPHDPFLRPLIEVYVTNSKARMAKEIILGAVEEWRAERPEKQFPAGETYSWLKTMKGKDEPKDFWIADILRYGYNAVATEEDKREALELYKKVANSRDHIEQTQQHLKMATIEIAMCYHFGQCAVRRNLDRAIAWYWRGLAQKEGLAYWMLDIAAESLNRSSWR